MLWPLVPNWSQGFKESLAFKTEILTSRSAKEQRRALRSTPRRTILYQAIADRDRMRAVDALMASSQQAVVQMPDVPRGVRTTSALPVSGNTVSLRSIPSWLVEGAAVALAAGRRVQVFTVDDVTGLNVTFSSAAVRSAPAGALLSPVVDGYISTTTRSSLVTDEVAQMPIDFDVLPGSDQHLSSTEPNYENWFNGREIFTLRPNWIQAPSIEYLRDVEDVDYGRGRIARFTPVEFGKRVQQGHFLLKDLDQVAYLRDFFLRMKGQRGEFYNPSWKNDLPPKGSIAADTNTFTVAGRDVYDNYKDDTVHKAILLRYRNSDAQTARKVVSIALVGGDSVLTLDEAWPFDISLASIRSVSWMPCCRLASDTLVLDWATDRVVRVQLNIRTLEEAVSEEESELDEATAYMVSTYGWTFTEFVFCDPLQTAVNVTYPEIGGI